MKPQDDQTQQTPSARPDERHDQPRDQRVSANGRRASSTASRRDQLPSNKQLASHGCQPASEIMSPAGLVLGLVVVLFHAGVLRQRPMAGRHEMLSRLVVTRRRPRLGSVVRGWRLAASSRGVVQELVVPRRRPVAGGHAASRSVAVRPALCYAAGRAASSAGNPAAGHPFPRRPFPRCPSLGNVRRLVWSFRSVVASLCWRGGKSGGKKKCVSLDGLGRVALPR